MPTRDAASGHGEGIAVSTAYDRSCTINRPFACDAPCQVDKNLGHQLSS